MSALLPAAFRVRLLEGFVPIVDEVGDVEGSDAGGEVPA
jgi:hypothetical protein